MLLRHAGHGQANLSSRLRLCLRGGGAGSCVSVPIVGYVVLRGCDVDCRCPKSSRTISAMPEAMPAAIANGQIRHLWLTDSPSWHLPAM